MDLRAIETAGYTKVAAPSSFGHPPKLEWIAIKSLRIDPVYQRDITGHSRLHVRRIAEAFDWSMFTPVVVAPAGSGLYAIVDGQHRSTAAALLGLDRVPCAVIDVNRAAQAAAFKAINGNVSKLHSVQIYHAALAAGDPEAMRVDAICKKSGVTILRFPTYSGLMKPGETIAYKVIATCTTKFGEDTTVAALKAIAGGGAPLNRGVIFGTSEVLHDHPDWWADDKRLRKAFDTFDLDSIWLEASARAARVKGTSAIDLFEAQLIEELEPHFRKGKAA